MRRASPPRRAPGLVALWLGASAPGLAAASRPTITWDAPAGCPDEAALAAELARYVDPAELEADATDIRARARPDGAGWSVVVTIAADGAAQERTLAVESCEAAVHAAAFVIAIAVEPTRRAPAETVPAPAEATTTTAPQATPPRASTGEAHETPPLAATRDAHETPPLTATRDAHEPAPPEPTARSPRRAVRGLVQIGPALQVGMLPVGAGLSAAAGLVWPRARLTAGYARWFAVEVQRAGDRPYGAEFSVHAAQLRAGPVVRAGPLELPLHLGLELGALRGAGVGGDINYTAAALWGAVTLGAGLAWAPRALRGHAALVLLTEAAISLRRPRFEFAGDLAVHRVGPAAFRGLVLVEARFP